jgi:hypothetical protein
MNAPTGLGKTNLALALSAHAAAGKQFLHWQVPRPSRVLFIDGEMSRRLLKQRLEDAVRRLGVHPTGLHILSREDVPHFQPLNTEAGMTMMVQVIAKISQRADLDLIVFDNVMSLVRGSMKDEEAWQETLPFILTLTEHRIGQLWIHHTGHDTSKGYGTKTREWQLDTVMHLTEAKRPDTDVSFQISFPKARERTPDTRRDFEEVTIALVNDKWISSTATLAKTKIEPLAVKFLDALRDAVIGSDTQMYRCPAAPLDLWRAECVKHGLIDPKTDAHNARSMFSKYKLKLIAANWIASNDATAWLLP